MSFLRRKGCLFRSSEAHLGGKGGQEHAGTGPFPPVVWHSGVAADPAPPWTRPLASEPPPPSLCNRASVHVPPKAAVASPWSGAAEPWHRGTCSVREALCGLSLLRRRSLRPGGACRLLLACEPWAGRCSHRASSSLSPPARRGQQGPQPFLLLGGRCRTPCPRGSSSSSGCTMPSPSRHVAQTDREGILF